MLTSPLSDCNDYENHEDNNDRGIPHSGHYESFFIGTPRRIPSALKPLECITGDLIKREGLGTPSSCHESYFIGTPRPDRTSPHTSPDDLLSDDRSTTLMPWSMPIPTMAPPTASMHQQRHERRSAHTVGEHARSPVITPVHAPCRTPYQPTITTHTGM